MRVYTYSQARQNLADVLKRAKTEEVIIRRRGGDTFAIVPKPAGGSPFDVSGIKTRATTDDILDAVKDGRQRPPRRRPPSRSR
jgi:prevent-host-death family protein